MVKLSLPAFLSHSLPSAKDERGFSLVEILIATTIMVVLGGGGIAAFSSFNDRQQVVEAGKTMQNFMRLAQTKATVADKPTGCNTLHAYRVKLTDESGSLSLVAVCNQPQVELNDAPQILPGGVVSDVTATLDFKVLHGGIVINNSAATQLSLPVKRTGNFASARYSFIVTKGGEIREGALE